MISYPKKYKASLSKLSNVTRNINSIIKKPILKPLMVIFCFGLGICFANSQVMPDAPVGQSSQQNLAQNTQQNTRQLTTLKNLMLQNKIKNTDPNKEAVGSLSSKLEVTPTGAATYDIAIEVPPGTAGMTPKLSISYNSQQGNGLLGMGFSLQGLTAINRTPQNQAQNGQIHGVDFTDADRFALNGQQLVAIKGDYAQDKTEYRTYIDSQAKIISYGRQGNGPQSFKVWTKAGQIAEYGFTADSRIKANIADPSGKILDNQTVKQWALDKIEDTAGNYLQVHYYQDETTGSFYPTEIDYTGNDKAGIKPYNKIAFVYTDRSDTKTLYQAGSKSTLSKRLSEIKTYAGDQSGNYQLVYDYHLNYETSPNTFRSRLTSIELFDAEGGHYPATVFDWQTNDEGWEQASQYLLPGEGKPGEGVITDDKGHDKGLRLLDLNGNGLTDFVQSGWWGDHATTIAYLNTGNGWQRATQYLMPSEGHSEDGMITDNDGHDKGVRFVDLSGNGLIDFVQRRDGDGKSNNLAYINTGNSWQKASEYLMPSESFKQGIISGANGTDAGVRFADFTGNGLIDFVQSTQLFDSEYFTRASYSNTGTGWTKATYLIPTATSPDEPPSKGIITNVDGEEDGLKFLDLNGNGLPDFVQSVYIVNEEHVQPEIERIVKAYLNTGSGWEETPEYTLPVGKELQKEPTIGLINSKILFDHYDRGLRFIDLNGDGLTDFVQGSNVGNDFAAYYINTGNGWKEAPEYQLPPSTYSRYILITDFQGHDKGVRFVDLNGSGLKDFVQSTYFGDQRVNLAYINTGHGWKNNPNYQLPAADEDGEGVITDKDGHDKGLRFVDLNGNGISDFVQNGIWGSKSIYLAYLNKAKKKPDMLIGITNGLGAKTTIDYEPLTSPVVYIKEHDAKYPNQDVQMPMYVVYQTSSDTATNDPQTLKRLEQQGQMNKIGKYSTVNQKNTQHITSYHYMGAKVNKLGWGFLGFHYVTTTDESTGIHKTTTYNQDAKGHLAYQPVATLTQRKDGGVLTDSQLTWKVKQYGDGTLNHTYYLPYLSQAIERHYTLHDANTAKNATLVSTKTTTTQLDDYGNAIDIVETLSGTSGSYTTHTQNDYQNDPDKWLLGELIKTTVTKSSPNNADITRTSSFAYDSNTGMLQQTVIEPDDAAYTLTKEFTRDQFGNITQTKISGTDIETRTNSATYDPEGRFILMQTNALGQTASQTTDPRFGKPLTITDLNGLTTAYKYDNFGRQSEIIKPDGTVGTISYAWCNVVFNKTNTANAFQATNSARNEVTDYAAIQSGQYKDPKIAVVGTGMQDQPIQAVYAVTTYTTGGTTNTNYYDQLNRNVASTTEGFDGRTIWKDTFYDDLGRVIQQSVPYFTGATPYYTRFKYDVLGRAVETTNPDDSVIKVNYDGLTTITTNPLNQQVTKIANVYGKIIKSIDNNGFQVTYHYDSYNNLLNLQEGQGTQAIKSTISYDKLGHKKSINDPDKGNWNYTYNVLGQLISQTDANGNTTTFSYDKLGRMISRTDKGGTSTWDYGNDKSQHNVGKLIKTEGISNNGKVPTARQLINAAKDGLGNYIKTINYNELSLPASITTNINGTSYTTQMSYDQFSRLKTIIYPGDVTVRNDYNGLGYLERKANAKTDVTYWQLNAMDAAGHVISESHSNGLITTKTYDPKTGFLTNIETKLNTVLALQRDFVPGITQLPKTQKIQKAKNSNRSANVKKTPKPIQTQADNENIVQNLQYSYDSIGNVKTRNNYVTSNVENFAYDNLNRLTTWNANGMIKKTYTYDDYGNLTYKSDLGTYIYGRNAGPHAVTSITNKSGATYNYQYDKNGNQISSQTKGLYRSITYTSFDKPNQILDKTYNSTVNYLYNSDRSRFARLSKSGNIETDTYFLGDYQLEVYNNKGAITLSNKYYLAPDTLYINKTDTSGKTQTQAVYTLLKDNLGSLTIITTSTAEVLQRFSYDCFGQQTQIAGKQLKIPLTHQGFTGHESIEEMNLIHMNGRLYDPILGRFLSADPEIQDPSNSQSLNRYSYCLNNPLAYTDPTGFFSFRHLFHDIGHAITQIFRNQYVQMGIIIAAACLSGGGAAYWWICRAAYAAMVTMVLGAISGRSNRDILLSGAITMATAGAFKFAGGVIKTIGWEAVPGNYMDYMPERAAVHGLVGGGLQVAEGGNFKDGFLSAAVAEALPIGSIGGKNAELTPQIVAERTAAAAIIGGTVAAATGGNFVSGAKTAAFAELFNDVVHKLIQDYYEAKFRAWQAQVWATNYEIHDLSFSLRMSVAVGGAALFVPPLWGMSAEIFSGFAASGVTMLYRAVNPEELADIQATGQFINRGSAMGKYFSTSPQGVASYARQAVSALGDEPYAMVSTRISSGSITPIMRATVDGGISSVVVPNSMLSDLVPSIHNYMPVP